MFCVAFAAMTVFAGFGCGGRADDDTLIIAGSGACEEILKRLADAYNLTAPGYRVEVPGSIGSSGGILAVKDKRCELARVALVPGSSVEGLEYLPFARDMVVFMTGAVNGVSRVTERQILDIYRGKTVDWSELGGRAAPIRPLLRESGDTAYKVLCRDFPGFGEMQFPEWFKTVYRDPDMLTMFNQYPAAIGWLTYSSLQPGLIALALDGAAPNVSNMTSGRYPYTIEYALVYNRRLTPKARKFVDFVFSPDGRSVIEAHGMLTVNGNQHIR